MVASTSVVLSQVAVGQKNSALMQNSLISAVQELQQLVNGLEAQPVMELNGGATTAAISTWTICTFNATPSYSAGTGLSGTTSGIRVLVAGRYQVTASVTWGINGTGTRRLIGVGTSVSSPDATHHDTRPPLGTSTLSHTISMELSLQVNDLLALWAFHDATAQFNVTGARMSARLMTD